MATTSLPVVHEQAGPGAAAAGDRAVGLVRLLVSFVAAGWIAGAVESVALPGATRIPKVIAFAAVFTSVASLLVAAAVVLVVVVARRFAAFGRLQAWAETLTSRDPDVDRAPVVRAYAIVVVAFVTLALVLVGSRFVFGALMELQVRELSEKLAAGVALVLAVLALVLVSLAPRLLQRPLTAIDRKVRLPLPAPRWTQFLLFVTLPAFVVLYPFVREFDAPLGRMGDAVRLLLLLCAGLQLALLWPTQGRAARVARRAFGVVLALQAAFVVASAFLYPVAGSARAAEQGMLAALGGRIARAATDADRDGTSSLFGGADCAGLDASRSPAALEIMGNGIDDDCDGADGAHGGAIAGISGDERFSGALAKGQVRRYDIVWVIIETVRADHVDAYGYDKPTMPHFRELASESLLFTRAFSQSSATVLSVQSMLTGMDPAAITWKRSRGHPQVGTENLFFAERMKALKYTTGIILENYTIRSLDALPRGYDVIYRAEADEKTSNNRPRRNPIVTAKAAEFLSTLKPT